MNKVLIVSLHETSEITSLLTKNMFEIVQENPDFIVCYGGDGTVLFAERIFPGIPKLIVKKSNGCRKCDYALSDASTVLSRIKAGNYEMQKMIKLETSFEDRKLIGLNEIQVHVKLPIHAIRFTVSLDGRKHVDLIGDGVIVATPFGSTGYYKSTGGTPFEKGIGISFNNLHNKKVESFVASESATVKVKINREPALAFADNNPRSIELKENSQIIIKKSIETATFIQMGKPPREHATLN